MPMPKGYEELVEGFREKIRGNVSSVKMTESETAAEVRQIVGFEINPEGPESPLKRKGGWPKGKPRGPRKPT